MFKTGFLIILLLALSGCDDEVVSGPNYTVHEGNLYGYEGGENDEGVQNLHMIEYIGNINGQYIFKEEALGMKMSCTNPCEYVKMWSEFFPESTQRFVYHEGNAFSLMLDDAINGRLVSRNSSEATSDQVSAHQASYAAAIERDRQIQAQASAYADKLEADAKYTSDTVQITENEQFNDGDTSVEPTTW